MEQSTAITMQGTFYQLVTFYTATDLFSELLYSGFRREDHVHFTCSPSGW